MCVVVCVCGGGGWSPINTTQNYFQNSAILYASVCVCVCVCVCVTVLHVVDSFLSSSFLSPHAMLQFC